MVIRVFRGICLFLTGGFFGVYLSNFEYFELDKEINIGDLLALTITSFVGLYIADTIQRNHNSDRREKEFLIDEIQALRHELAELSKFNDSGQYPFEIVKTWFKTFNTKIAHLKQLFLICDSGRDLDLKVLSVNHIALRRIITSVSPVNGNINLDTLCKGKVEAKLRLMNKQIYTLILAVNKKN